MMCRSVVRFPEPAEAISSELCLRHADYKLVGTSIAALATAFCVDRLRLAVDMGRCSTLLAAQETVLLTHCHSDHVAGLVAWLSAHTRRFEGAPTRLFLPADRREALLTALEIWPELDGVRRRVDLAGILTPARAGHRVELGPAGWARAFEVHHGVPSLGWAVGETGRERPVFAFAGDGTVQPFAVVDCSFVDEGTRVAARLGGHGHIQDWIDLHPTLPCDILVLAHLPAEITAEQVFSKLQGLARSGPTVVPWLAPPGTG